MGAQPPDKPVLLIEDDRTLGRVLAMQLESAGYRVTRVESVAAAREVLAAHEPLVAVLDVRLPDASGLELVDDLRELCPVVVLTAFGSIGQAVAAIRAGADDYLVKPVQPEALLLAIERALERRGLQRLRVAYEHHRREAAGEMQMVGTSPALQQVREQIALVAPAETTALVLGESGTGKELVARALHEHSPRADKPLVVVDCTTLQDTLFESELFGHERGAFTGAERVREGLIQVAEGGTVFLDEVGDLTPAAQAKLLRTLETRSYRRVGSSRDRRCDVRFVAATNRNLLQHAEEGRFREDLYYRLSAFVIEVPPLRDRPEDIRPLARHFLARRTAYRHIPKSFTEEALAALERRSWPGNVRELRNVVERSVILSAESELVTERHLVLGPVAVTASGLDLRFDREPTLDEIRDAYIDELMRRYQRRRTVVAERLGIRERTLYRLLRERRQTTVDGIEPG